MKSMLLPAVFRTIAKASGRVLLLAALTGPVLANSPEPDRGALEAAAHTCTAQGAFGYRFGEHDTRPRDTGITPFEIETLGRQSDGLFEIAAVAWFGKAPMSGEDRMALASWVYHLIDTKIAASHHFAKRAAKKDGALYFSDSDPEQGYALDLSHDGVRVRLACIDLERRKNAWKQVKGVGPESNQKIDEIGQPGGE